ncbi:RluA family uridine synthase [Sesbania bispinosa]|nr:RluA family uridine synthase [Sesbania bispinosa]
MAGILCLSSSGRLSKWMFQASRSHCMQATLSPSRCAATPVPRPFRQCPVRRASFKPKRCSKLEECFRITLNSALVQLDIFPVPSFRSKGVSLRITRFKIVFKVRVRRNRIKASLRNIVGEDVFVFEVREAINQVLEIIVVEMLHDACNLLVY